jgi:Tfp pilus assembly protein PilN
VNPVNLLPTKHRPRTPTGGQQGSAYVLVGALGAILVLVVFYVLTVNGVNTRKEQVANAKAETARAQARAASLSSYGNFSKIKEQRVQSVRDLASGRIDWERLTRGLARILPTDVWLLSANASASGAPPAGGAGTSSSSSSSATSSPGAAAGPKVQVVGCASSQAVVAVTLVRLRELSGATDVQLNEISRPEDTAATSGSSSGSSSNSGGDSDCGKLHGKLASKWDATVTFAQNPAPTGPGTTTVPKSLGGGA